MRKIIIIIVLLGFMCTGVGAGGGNESSIYEETIEILRISRLDAIIPYVFMAQFVPGAGIEAEDLSNVKEVDLESVLSPDESKIGSTFTGSSGITYRLEVEKDVSEQEKRDMAKFGLIPAGVWVPVDEEFNGIVDVTDMPYEDQTEAPVTIPSTNSNEVPAKVGDTWTGPSGQEYVLEIDTSSDRIDVPGIETVWVPVDED